LIGLTSLWIDGRPRGSPEINPRRAVFVLGKIDEILSWEKMKDQEKDVRFVELGEYLCEVRAKQYWKLEKLTSFDNFLEKRFPASRRKAYYLMAIHENLTRVPKPQLRKVGWSKATELVKVAPKDGERFDCATWLHKAKELPKRRIQNRGGTLPCRQRNRAMGNNLFQAIQKPNTGSGTGARNGSPDARIGQITWLLP